MSPQRIADAEASAASKYAVKEIDEFFDDDIDKDNDEIEGNNESFDSPKKK